MKTRNEIGSINVEGYTVGYIRCIYISGKYMNTVKNNEHFEIVSISNGTVTVNCSKWIETLKFGADIFAGSTIEEMIEFARKSIAYNKTSKVDPNHLNTDR